MKKIIKWTGRIFLVLLIGIAILLCYAKFYLPRAGEVMALKVIATPELISGPIKEGTIGKGGEYFGKNVGLPGDFYAKNITPYNLEKWSDGELYHVITTGINKNGEALFPIMPYKAYAHMSPEDVKAIIAYVRTLKPVKSSVPERSVEFPMNFIINTIPSAATPMNKPKTSDRVAYGKYITTIAGCAECHTPQENGEKIAGMDFAGGFELKMPFGVIRSANITSDETGIAHWTKEAFISRFKSYLEPSNITKNIKSNEFNTVMPWAMYAGMKEEDLGAIYDYLRTVKPVKNKVQLFSMK